MKQSNRLLNSLIIAAFVSALLFVTGCSSSKVQSKNSSNQLVMDSSIKQGKLDNGMSYFVRENGQPKNRIQLRLVVKTGACMEDEDQKGVAHFVEHMCFNGTEHFEKSAIVDYFESIGMQFGPEVNAETNFEQTVYMLELPADDPEMLKTSLLVLHDWASSVTFDPEEVEKERGVIIEEWRMRTQGVQWRALTTEINNLMKDSRFADRLPIGELDVIKNVPCQRIVDFYKKWYRPENMAVVAVGDVKVSVLENAIKEVMGTIPASEKKTKVPEYKIPYQTAKTFTVMHDKELSVVEAYIFQQNKNTEPVTTVEQLREEYVLGIASTIFNQRCQEKTNLPEAEWLGAGFGSGSFANNNNFYMLSFYPKTGRFNEAFKAILDEYERFMNYGVTETELARLKQAYIQSLQQSYANKENHNSVNYAGNIVNHYLTGRIYISNEDDLKLGTEIVNQITAEEVREVSNKYFGNRGTMMVLFVPESMEIPSEKEIRNIWENYESEAEAYEDDVTDDGFMKRPAKKAKISDKKTIKELGGTQYTFENGVKVITKKTDFQKDSIVMYAGSKGGLFQLKEEDIPSAQLSVDYALLSGFGGVTYNQFQKIATAKNLNISLRISGTEENINAGANKNNIEETLQFINLVFSKPQFGEEAWATMVSQYSQIAETYGARPMQVYSDTIAEALYGKTWFHAPTDKNWIAMLNAETAERVYRERFANPADFTFVFAGDFNEKELVDLCAYYLGTLKTSDDREQTKYVYFPFPKESKTLVVEKGVDENGDLYMCFGGELPECDDMEQTFKEGIIINQLASLLDIRLREVIREDKSGSYGVSCSAYIDGWPQRFYQASVEFGCEPARQDELSATVIETIKDIQSGNVSDELIAKLKESYTRSIETSLRNNYWWINRFAAEVIFTYEPLWFTKNSSKAADYITKEALVDAANKYLNTERVLKAYLKPEVK